MAFRRAAAHRLPSFALASWVVAAACSGSAPDPDPAAAGEAAGEEASPPVPARYLTHLLFAGTDGSTFVATFDQTVGATSLVRSYGAWLARASEWDRLLAVRDTLPVPRAGWRILPSGGMTLRVGDAGGLIGLVFAGSGVGPGPPEAVRIEAGEEVSVWSGPTGQRESLALGALRAGGDTVPGVLFFRRAARALAMPEVDGASHAFVLTDEDGNGLVLQADSPGEPAVAHAWLHGSESSWSDVVFEPLESSGGDAIIVGWRFEIPDTDLRGTIRPRADPPMPGAPALRIECELVADEEVFRFVGLSVSLPFP